MHNIRGKFMDWQPQLWFARPTSRAFFCFGFILQNLRSRQNGWTFPEYCVAKRNFLDFFNKQYQLWTHHITHSLSAIFWPLSAIFLDYRLLFQLLEYQLWVGNWYSKEIGFCPLITRAASRVGVHPYWPVVDHPTQLFYIWIFICCCCGCLLVV